MLFFVISDRKLTKVFDQKIHFEDVTLDSGNCDDHCSLFFINTNKIPNRKKL